MRKVTTLPVIEMTVCQTNADQNRAPGTDRVILHTMVGTVAGANARFNDCTSKVSAHYGVGYDGSLVHWVDEDWVAYHAGNYTMNQRSIGIEHEDMGNYNSPRPDSLYLTSANLVADICKFYGIPCDRQHILKHNEVVATSCPDALDVERIVTMASRILSPQNAPQLATDQTKYDFGNPYGILEMQAAKSQLVAKDSKINELSISITALNQKITDLQTSTPPSNQPQFKSGLAKWIFSLAQAIG